MSKLLTNECRNCSGWGYMGGNVRNTCKVCKGTGVVGAVIANTLDKELLKAITADVMQRKGFVGKSQVISYVVMEEIIQAYLEESK